MIDLEKEDQKLLLTIIKKHAPDCEIRVFGSRINGKAKPYSDIDIALNAQQPLENRILQNLKEDLQESTLAMRVDILDWNTLSDSFKETIQTNGYELLN